MINHNEILKHTLAFLDKVNTTGIEESNNLVQSAVLIDRVIKGELIIVQAPRTPLEDDSEESD